MKILVSTARKQIASWKSITSPLSAKAATTASTICSHFARVATQKYIGLGSNGRIAKGGPMTDKDKKLSEKRYMKMSDEEKASLIEQLSTLVDLVMFQGWIGRKTKFGKKPGPTSWHYTEQLLRQYNSPVDVAEIATLFEGVEADNEVEGARFCALNLRLVK
jgi:hypothetical protein